MKPKEKQMLAKNRGLIVRSIDVLQIMGMMRQEKVISKNEEQDILENPMRRQRVSKFLEILETKKTTCYEIFLNSLEEFYPHLYLSIVNWDGEDDQSRFASNIDDEWVAIRHLRKWLVAEMDAQPVLPYLQTKKIITDDEADDVKAGSTEKERTEALLDILETKSGNAYEIFLESLGEYYPHIYLMLTDRDDDDELF